MKYHLIIPSLWAVGMHHWGGRQLSVGSGYLIEREMNNIYDKYAVVVKDPLVTRAYIMKSQAAVIARLMDMSISDTCRLKPKEDGVVLNRRKGTQQRCNIGCVITSEDLLKKATEYLDYFSYTYEVKELKMPRGKTSKYDESNLQKAVESVQNGLMTIRMASNHFGIPKSTIGDRISGKRGMVVGRGKKPAVPSDIEEQIADTLKVASQTGLGVTRKQLLIRTGTICKRLKIQTPFKNGIPGKNRWEGFKNRHPELSIRKPEKLGSLRCRMLNKTKVEAYFNDLGQHIASLGPYDVPKRVWNCDETGKTFEHDPPRIIAEKGSRNVVSRTSSSSTHITIMACCNAAGQTMPPLLIVQGKTSRSLYGFKTEDAPQGAMWDMQASGWIDDDIGERWFKELFLKHCGPERPQLLVLDGHSSHESLGLLMAARENNIKILALPPHTTHYLQPLDRSVFGPFNDYYDEACSSFLQENVLHQINRWSFPSLMNKAWEKAFTGENIRAGFRACGIFPFNPQAIPESAFAPSLPTEEQSSVPVSTPPVEPITVPSETTSSAPTMESPGVMESSEVMDSPRNESDPPALIELTPNYENTEYVEVHINNITTEGSIVPLTPDFACDVDLNEMLNIVATAESDGVATIPSESNLSLITDILLPSSVEKVPVQNTSKKQNSKIKQCHRLLTSDEVIAEKQQQKRKKEEREKEQKERKERKAMKKEKK